MCIHVHSHKLTEKVVRLEKRNKTAPHWVISGVFKFVNSIYYFSGLEWVIDRNVPCYHSSRVGCVTCICVSDGVGFVS